MDEPDDLHELERTLLDGIRATAPPTEPTSIAPDWLAPVYTAQIQSRVLDHTARWLRGTGKGYYTIGSAGHESNGAASDGLGRQTETPVQSRRTGPGGKGP